MTAADQPRKDGARTTSQRKREQREKELLEKLPDELDPAAERGERLETGKMIAEGTKPDEGESAA